MINIRIIALALATTLFGSFLHLSRASANEGNTKVQLNRAQQRLLSEIKQTAPDLVGIENDLDAEELTSGLELLNQSKTDRTSLTKQVITAFKTYRQLKKERRAEIKAMKKAFRDWKRELHATKANHQTFQESMIALKQKFKQSGVNLGVELDCDGSVFGRINKEYSEGIFIGIAGFYSSTCEDTATSERFKLRQYLLGLGADLMLGELSRVYCLAAYPKFTSINFGLRATAGVGIGGHVGLYTGMNGLCVNAAYNSSVGFAVGAGVLAISPIR